MVPPRSNHLLKELVRGRARGMSYALSGLFRFFRWMFEVAAHSGLAGLLIVLGFLAVPATAALAWLGPEDNRRETLIMMGVALGVAVLAAAWRKRSMRAARRRRAQAATAAATEQFLNPRAMAWTQGLGDRVRAGAVGAGTIPDAPTAPPPPPPAARPPGSPLPPPR